MRPSTPNPLCHAGSPKRVVFGSITMLVHRLEAVSSTNDLARAWLAGAQKPEPGAWIARVQTAGRGTRGRSWASPPGGLWMSLAMPLGERANEALPGLGLRAGLATARAIREILPDEVAGLVRLRWPNDLVAVQPDGPVRKVGGTLIEQASPGIIVGVGLNANNTPPATDDAGHPLRTPPVSLAGLASHEVALDALAESILGHLVSLVPARGLPADVARELEAVLHRPGGPVRVTGRDGTEHTGVVRGLSDRPESLGALLLERPDGEIITVTSGDLS